MGLHTCLPDQNCAASSLIATASEGAFDAWDAGLDACKTCQPCQSYNRRATHWSGDQRRMTEHNNGQGDEEWHG